MRIRGILAAALALLGAGCSSVVRRETPQKVNFAQIATVGTVAATEALLDFRGTRLQSVEGTWKEHAFAAEVVLKGDGESFTAVFLAPQMRLATITLTRPHALVYERAPAIPQMFQPEYAIFDLAVINLDFEALRRALAPELRVEERGAKRRVCAAADGRLIAEMETRADGARVFRNEVYGYEWVLRDM